MERQIAAKMTMWSDPTINGNTEQVTLNAVSDSKGVNKTWAQCTPAGMLSLSIDNPAAQKFFQKGKEYIITIREARPGE